MNNQEVVGVHEMSFWSGWLESIQNEKFDNFIFSEYKINHLHLWVYPEIQSFSDIVKDQ